MRVAILGMGPSADGYVRHAAGVGNRHKVFDEVWTVNAFGSVFKADRVFHMDDIRIQKIRADAGNVQIRHLLEWLKDAPGPIYTSRTLPKEPNPLLEQTEDEGLLRWLRAERALQEMGGFDGLVEYPLGEVLSSTGGPPYFTSTVPYAIAMALAGKAAGLQEDVTELSPFGIDYSHINAIKAEVGRSCCEFWLGRCIEKGIHLKLPPDTWLLGTSTKNRNLYGYDTRSVSIGWDADQSCCSIGFRNKGAPTAEMIERAYSHDPQTQELAHGQ